MMEKINWGILGCGKIAHSFAEALTNTEGNVAYAAAARNGARAKAFAGQWGFRKSFGSYVELAGDPEVDIIYIATPHSYHFAHTKLCLESGKHVLCEKPFTINAAQMQILKDLAAKQNLFLMEALWTRFLPDMIEAGNILRRGAIGDPVIMEADFGIRFPYHPEHRLFNPLLGGGALLDLGIYPLFLSLYLFGEPQILKAHSLLDKNRIDLVTTMISESDSGVQCQMNTTVLANTPVRARITGSEGSLDLHSWWFQPTDLTLKTSGNTEEVLRFPPRVNGYEYEIMESAKCLLENKKESTIMPLDFSLILMDQLDRVRRETGISYPPQIESTREPYGWKEL